MTLPDIFIIHIYYEYIIVLLLERSVDYLLVLLQGKTWISAISGLLQLPSLLFSVSETHTFHRVAGFIISLSGGMKFPVHSGSYKNSICFGLNFSWNVYSHGGWLDSLYNWPHSWQLLNDGNRTNLILSKIKFSGNKGDLLIVNPQGITLLSRQAMIKSRWDWWRAYFLQSISNLL